ncbi:MAG: tRNA (adenosine(37)-N6)-threonylcarbamoyltransferase complex transferase subunit TsaD, partial [Deltaproteobacteria bacterium]
DEIHHKYGGIVPELASRQHLETVIPVVEEALNQAGVSIDEIDAIGVTQGPGLVGSILVGLSFAKAVTYVKGMPFVGVNHIEAHPLSVFLTPPNPPLPKGGSEGFTPNFPFIALVVSGGHTTLFKFKDFCDCEIVGQTRDDAAGEAFDKVAKLLGLGYPGGAVIDRLARSGNPSAIKFTRPYISKDTFDFSFSGIKTAVLNYLKDFGKGDYSIIINDLSAGFQEAVVDVLIDKAVAACKANNIRDLSISGGVACNTRLREKLAGKSRDNGIRLFLPEAKLCSDNGAMIAACAYHLLKKGGRGELDMNAMPSM